MLPLELPPAPAHTPKEKPTKKKTPRPKSEHCLNCGAATPGKFCAECGQENKDHSVALKPLLADLLAEQVSWDSRLLRTLTALIIRPGFLTNEYNAGRRAAYLSPLKLYLTVSVLFFLLLAWKTPIARYVQFDVKPAGSSPVASVGSNVHDLPPTEAAYEVEQKQLPPSKRDPPFERFMAHHLIRASQSKAAFLAALLGDIPKMMFFLLPAFAVSLKLLYLRRKRLYVEHLIFLLHVHAFAFLLLAPLLLFHPDWLIVGASLALMVYVFAAMRIVYRQGWGKTLVKFTLLAFGYVVLLSLCIAGTTMAALLLL